MLPVKNRPGAESLGISTYRPLATRSNPVMPAKVGTPPIVVVSV